MHRIVLLLVLAFVLETRAADDFPLTEDSKTHADIPQGELIKDTYAAKDGSVFPGTERGYTIYLPPDYLEIKRAGGWPFMVFHDGVIYNAPVVFDNLIAKKQIPPLIGIFLKPGIVPAANPNALPRYNRSYEYDSVTDTYARFLIDELLPALEAKHHLKLSTDPDDAAISGNSSGGIAAFMVGWHRPDRFRRIFSGVGTYVGIHGADQLPVLVRKTEPRPLRVFLQSGTNDNNLYCGDWWMANQTLERALTWAGYDVNHTWGEGGHNQKHASQIFPDVLRWLWHDYTTAKQIKPNPRGESKWKGDEVIGDGKWETVENRCHWADRIIANKNGDVFWKEESEGRSDPWLVRLTVDGKPEKFGKSLSMIIEDMAFGQDNKLYILATHEHLADTLAKLDSKADIEISHKDQRDDSFVELFCSVLSLAKHEGAIRKLPANWTHIMHVFCRIAFSPDQTVVYKTHADQEDQPISVCQLNADGLPANEEAFYELQKDFFGRVEPRGLCVDTNGWLYVATALGIQVCDQAGRVNFIIPTPQPPHDVCFGGKDLGELFIACGDKIYKRPTKAHGIVSGQMAPIKPAPPKL